MAVDIIARGMAANRDLITAYQYAVAAGYTGTEEEFKTDMGAIAGDTAQIAQNAADIAFLLGVIDGTLAAYTADTLTAPANITTGEYILANGLLYRATTNVASGSTLTPNGNVTQVTVGEELTKVIASDARKADADGTSPNLTAGNALQLVSTVGVEDQVPYNFRASGGGADIGDRETDMIVGGTVAWNQGLSDGMPSVSDGATITGSDGVYTFTASGQGNQAYRQSSGKADHVYLASVTFRTTDPANVKARMWGTDYSSADTTDWQTKRVIMKMTATGGFTIAVRDYRTGDWDGVDVKWYMLFDLTQMFGTTIANYIYSLKQVNPGDGVEWFRKLFPNDYYAYDAGTLRSVQTSAHKTVGFNALSEPFVRGKKWNGGTYKNGTDNDAASPAKIRVIPGATYCFSATKAQASCYLYVYEFDVDGNYIHGSPSYQVLSDANGYHRTFTVHSDTNYVGLYLYRSNAVLQLSEIDGINWNLSWDGERDGEYEPYQAWNYPLDDSLTLRGIPKLDANNKLRYDGDTYESNGTVMRRYAFHELSDLAWSRTTVNGVGYFIAKPDASTTSTGNAVSFGWCSVYSVIENGAETTGGLPGDGVISFRCGYFGGGNLIAVRDDSISTVPDLRTKITGNGQIVTRLLTPTTETADPYTNPQIVSDWGTEEYVDAAVEAGEREVAIPVGHNTLYQNNLKAKLEAAPDLPDGDGDYLLRQTNGENAYVPLVIPAELPTAPGTDGTYTLTVTVTDGTPTLSWVANT